MGRVRIRVMGRVRFRIRVRVEVRIRIGFRLGLGSRVSLRRICEAMRPCRYTRVEGTYGVYLVG